MHTSFDAFKLRQETRQALDNMGYTEPTPVQAEAIAPLLEGRDLLAQARTGTGKTAAFGIPVVDATAGKSVQTLVLVPTRELANQVAQELNRIGKGSPFNAASIYGGVGYKSQIKALRRNSKTTCIVACPGRLLDLLENKGCNLDDVRTVVLDEADRMLDMGFVHDIEKILAYVPGDHQTIMTSATMPDGIRKLSHQYLIDPVTVQPEEGSLGTPLTDQFRIMVRGEATAQLVRLIEKEDPERAVVFTDTKHTAKRMAAKLKAAGYKADALQGNMSQRQRDRTMKALRTGETRIMVATDVAARGIDVEELTHVIQFDLPKKPEDHVHRTGRTGRAGKDGRAFLFAQPNQAKKVDKIAEHAGVPIKSYDLGQVPRLPEHIFKAGPKPRGYESVTAGGNKGGGRGRGRGRRRR
ncbi:MAG: DEAD/DEAH box helicase [Candidatus Thermoplasmatota archaeon]|nr:DEAD/DEAH box helicase [Candidatus Thermoplasmatota archaeon]